MVYTLFEIIRGKKNYEYLNNVTPPVKHALDLVSDNTLHTFVEN